MVINDRVYDVTDFLGFHPAGIEIMLEHAGTDASTAFFEKGHSLDAVAMLEKYFIGELVKVTKNFLLNINPFIVFKLKESALCPVMYVQILIF